MGHFCDMNNAEIRLKEGCFFQEWETGRLI
jgi:hypothetical protein